jgi:superfamily II DNA or RNA helicase
MPGLFDTPSLGPDTITPFPHQRRAIDNAREALRRHPGALIVHATGTGKGTVIAKTARMVLDRDPGKKVLVLTHTDELIRDLAGRLDLAGIEPAIEQGDQFARALFEPQVVVGSVMTLCKTERLTSYPEDYFGFILVDEAHHGAKPGGVYQKIVARFPKAKRLGFTATPRRGDDLSLGGLFPVVADTFSILDAWDAERETGVQYLCDLVPTKLDINIDLRKLKPGKHDFTDEDLDRRIAPMIEVICNKSAEKIADRQTIAFFPSIRSAAVYAKGMRDLGFSAEAVWGDDPDREQKVKRYRDGDIQILSNMQLIVEGFDVPNTSAVLLCRPTKSWTMYLQMIGRGSRRGKKDCLIIDPGYITEDFGLVQPTDLIDVPGFDREIARLAAELIQERPGLSLRSAIEEARVEQEDRTRRRQQTAIRMSIREREVVCAEETFSMKALHHDGEVFTGKVVAADAGFQGPSVAQVDLLVKLGYRDAQQWSKTRASDTIGRFFAQKKAGKSHQWQRGKLIRSGVDAAQARDMSAQQASEYLDQIDRFNEKRRRR